MDAGCEELSGPDRIEQFNTIIVPWLEAGAPEEEPDMQFDDKIPDTHKTVRDALVAAINAERAIEALSRRQARRHQRLLERQQRLTARLATATQVLSDLPEGVTEEEIRGLLEKVEATLQEAVEDASDDSDEG